MVNIGLSPQQAKNFFKKALIDLGHKIESVEEFTGYPGGALSIKCKLKDEEEKEYTVFDTESLSGNE
jgi:hypothetical protein